MTVTTPTCDVIRLYTTEITNIVPGDVFELSLTRKYNCGSSTVLNLIADVLTIVSSDADGTTFEITAAQYYEDLTAVKFCEGVYFLQINMTYSSEAGSTTYVDSVCSLLDCENIIKCKVKDYVLSTMDVRPFYMLDAIGYSTDCDTCNCDNMCNMYNDLLATINYTIDGTTTGCGCS